MRKHKDIKLVIKEERKIYLVSEPNYHIIFFSENLLVIEIRKTKILINEPVYLGLSLLQLSKRVMHEFWYHYVKPKYGGKVKLGYIDIDTGSLYR